MSRAAPRAREQQATHDAPPADTSVRQPSARAPRFATASHDALFGDEAVVRCDVCSEPLDPKEDDEQGTGVYVWARGGEVRREDAPLCPACSAAVFANAIGLVDFDDEE